MISEGAVSYMKDLIWEYGLTKKEAEAYYVMEVSGEFGTNIASAEGVAYSLIYTRVRNAKRKIRQA